MDDNETMELDELLALGNEGAPKEWLACLTGEGIGGGSEGIDAEAADAILAAEPAVEQAIQATYETLFRQCNSANYTRGRGGNSVQYIVIHYTAGSKTAEGAAFANCIYFGRESVGASAHYFVDDGYTIWQSVSDGDTAWHAGNWAINQRSIGIEVCSAGAFTEAEIDRLSWLVQQLMGRYGVPASRVIRHYDANGKRCPAYYVDDARWAALRARITGGSSGAASSGSGFSGGLYRCNVDKLNVRDRPTTAGAVVASYSRGETVTIDNWYTVADGYVWGRYTARSGKVRYIAVGPHTGKAEADDYLTKV